MYRTRLPRIYELRDLILDPSAPNAYFQGFEGFLTSSKHARALYLDLEQELEGLEQTAWESLKNEAKQYLVRKDKSGRGWQQLFDILNQAYGYNYLKTLQCTTIRFVPRSTKEGVETPDIEGESNSGRVLCEVKTMNISQDEVQARHEVKVRSIKNQLEQPFFGKLDSIITKAKSQLSAYDPRDEAKHCVYICICFDDLVGHYEDEYLGQIDRHLTDNPDAKVNVILRVKDKVLTKSAG